MSILIYLAISVLVALTWLPYGFVHPVTWPQCVLEAGHVNYWLQRSRGSCLNRLVLEKKPIVLVVLSRVRLEGCPSQVLQKVVLSRRQVFSRKES